MLLLFAADAASAAEDSAWVQMFNGKDINDWVPKFSNNMALGVNPDSTFRVQDGYLYDYNHLDYNQTKYGHLFYKKKVFSYFLLRAQYRFIGKTNPPNFDFGWNIQNNGLMIFGQTPESMGLTQDYPNSIEVQLLGPVHAHTANVCTPGTFIAYKGNANYTQHCTDATYPSAWGNNLPFDSAGWSSVTVRALSDSLVQHFINGVNVMEYSKMRLDDGTPIKEGSISIQAEGASTQFRKIEYLDLVGCMVKGNAAYRSYFVKSNPSACSTTGVQPQAAAAAGSGPFRFLARGNGIEVEGQGTFTAQILALDGTVLGESTGSGMVRLAGRYSGLHLVRAKGPMGMFTVKLAMP